MISGQRPALRVLRGEIPWSGPPSIPQAKEPTAATRSNAGLPSPQLHQVVQDQLLDLDPIAALHLLPSPRHVELAHLRHETQLRLAVLTHRFHLAECRIELRATVRAAKAAGLHRKRLASPSSSERLLAAPPSLVQAWCAEGTSDESQRASPQPARSHEWHHGFIDLR